MELAASVRRALQLWTVLSRDEQLDRVEHIIVLDEEHVFDREPDDVDRSVQVKEADLMRRAGPALGRLVEGGSAEFTELAEHRTKLTLRLQLRTSPGSPFPVTRRLAELRLQRLMRRLAAAAGDVPARPSDLPSNAEGGSP